MDNTDATGLLQMIEADRKDYCEGLPPKDDVTVLVVQSRSDSTSSTPLAK